MTTTPALDLDGVWGLEPMPQEQHETGTEQSSDGWRVRLRRLLWLLAAMFGVSALLPLLCGRSDTLNTAWDVLWGGIVVAFVCPVFICVYCARVPLGLPDSTVDTVLIAAPWVLYGAMLWFMLGFVITGRRWYGYALTVWSLCWLTGVIVFWAVVVPAIFR